MLSKATRRELTKIAHEHGVTVSFVPRKTIAYVDIFQGHITLSYWPNASHSTHVSDFMHELGHVVDYRASLYRGYYRKYPSKQDLKRWALRAELHADLTGEKLMRRYYPKLKFVHTYKYKKWQKFLKEYWGIE